MLATASLKRPTSPLPHPAKRLKETEKENILEYPEEPIEIDEIRRDHLSSPENLMRTFQSHHFTLTSPGMFSYTNCGQVPHVTADLGCSGGGDLCTISLESIISSPGIGVLEKLGLSFAEFMNISQKKVLLTPMRISEPLDLTNFNDKMSISVWSKGGRKRLTFGDYSRFIQAGKPDMFICMSDIVPATASLKRTNKACYRTLHWVNQSLAFLDQHKEISSEPLAVIPGSGHKKLMLRAATILAHRPVFGYVIMRCTLPKGSSWRHLISDVISLLPPEKPVILLGALNISEVVAGYNAGCHFVDSSYCLQHTNMGHAITLDNTINPSPTNPSSTTGNPDFGPTLVALSSQTNSANPQKNDKKSKDTGKIPIFSEADYIFNNRSSLDLKESHHGKEFFSITPLCSCFTCTRHTRGYINHLLVTNELLGPTLLMLHNLHQARAIVDEVKSALEKKEFGSLVEKYVT